MAKTAEPTPSEGERQEDTQRPQTPLPPAAAPEKICTHATSRKARGAGVLLRDFRIQKNLMVAIKLASSHSLSLPL